MKAGREHRASLQRALEAIPESLKLDPGRTGELALSKSVTILKGDLGRWIEVRRDYKTRSLLQQIKEFK